MKKELLQEIKKNFPNEFSSKKFDYIPSMKDLTILFHLINSYAFGNKLDFRMIKISIGKYGIAKTNKGLFNLDKNDSDRSEIIILKYDAGDNFSQIVSVLCHEMIHAYDRYFGEMLNNINACLDRENYVSVNKTNSTQYINGYDVHGRFFEKQISLFKSFGIIVKKTYSIGDNKLMKKIDENDDNYMNKFNDVFLSKNGRKIDMSYFTTPILDESEDDPAYKEKVETLYNSLKNCYKDLSYIDKDHWYITIA